MITLTITRKNMIKVDGKYFLKNSEKIGFMRDEHIFDHEGEKLGYYDNDHVFDKNGHKLAYLQDDKICFEGSVRTLRVEDNNKDIVGGGLSNIERAAVRVLLGE
jgi:hypothetical protein